MPSRRRARLRIYVDVLRAIHATTKAGHALTHYRIERLSGLTHSRLKACLRDLRSMGLVDGSSGVTNKGYVFLEEVSSKVIPVLHKYGLWHDAA